MGTLFFRLFSRISVDLKPASGLVFWITGLAGLEARVLGRFGVAHTRRLAWRAARADPETVEPPCNTIAHGVLVRGVGWRKVRHFARNADAIGIGGVSLE